MTIRHTYIQTHLTLATDGEIITILAAKRNEADTTYVLSAFADGKAVHLNPTLQELCKLQQQINTVIDRS